MVALREAWSEKHREEQGPGPEAEGARWMSLRRAACHLDVCTSTLRRRMRKGQLPWRVVNHGRRWSMKFSSPGLTPVTSWRRTVVSLGAISTTGWRRRRVHTPGSRDGRGQMINSLSQAGPGRPATTAVGQPLPSTANWRAPPLVAFNTPLDPTPRSHKP
jgi:hypothetical protein